MKRLSVCLMLILVAMAASAQQGSKPPARTTSSSLGLVVFPAKNQTAEVRQQDENVCYAWAKENTGFDPLAAFSAALSTPEREAPKGSVAKGAAGGAAAGAAIGAVAGDAGKGAAVGATAGAIRGRMARKMADRKSKEAEAQAEQQTTAKMDGFRKAFGACMEAKGYTVK